MSKLNIDQKSIFGLFADKKADFLIPDYQRPYAWETEECQTLWEDIINFAFPDNDKDKFDYNNDEYFLGPIVTFKNENNQMEVIDGQQRLTTALQWMNFLPAICIMKEHVNQINHLQQKHFVNSMKKIIMPC